VPPGAPTPGHAKDLLQPTRELVFEKGKAPGNVVFSDKLGLAYVACLGDMAQRERGKNEKPPPPEVCVVETKTGRVVKRVPSPRLNGVDISPDERYLLVTASGGKAEQGVRALYAVADLSRPIVMDKGVVAGMPAAGCDAALYLGYVREHKLRRVTANGEQSMSFGPHRHLMDMCLSPDCSRLYVTVGGWEDRDTEVDDWPPPSLLVLDPRTLKVLQTVTLPGRTATWCLTPWVGGHSLVACGQNEDLFVDIIPLGPDGLPTPGTEPLGIAITYRGQLVAVDEKRSLAYCFSYVRGDRFINVVDLAGRRLVGRVHLWDEYLDWPDLSFSRTTDELWLADDSMDRIWIYRVEDVIKRARESGATKPVAGSRGSEN
jgi:hypothetical protein